MGSCCSSTKYEDSLSSNIIEEDNSSELKKGILNVTKNIETIISYLKQKFGKNHIVVVYFSEADCPVCSQLTPIIEKIAIQNKQAMFIMCQDGDESQIEEFYGTMMLENPLSKSMIMGVPALFIYKDGMLEDQFYGSNIEKLKNVCKKCHLKLKI